jgi:anti-sigma B factor antagonist
MKITHENYDQLTVVALKGELTADHADRLRKLAEERLAAQARDFVLDVKEMDFVDSKGLETLLWLQERCGERLGQVRLAGATPNVEKCLTITRLSARFDRHADVDTAVKSLRI